MICKSCGDDMSGDGYKIPYHCIRVSEKDWWYQPPDSGPYFCDEDLGFFGEYDE